MKLTLGNPNGGTNVEIELDGLDDKQIGTAIEDGLHSLKLAHEVWKKWTLKNETADEKRKRLKAEELQRITERAQDLELKRMQQMLKQAGQG